MKIIYSLIIFALPYITFAQHTFSIVAIDTITKEIGSAGATCGNSIIWPGTPGAKIISDIIPGRGAIHTQAYYLPANQINANNRMYAGDSPDEIISWLLDNDSEGNPEKRQYGIVDLDSAGNPRSAGYTGALCDNYKKHILGRNYAIQGNILLGQQILDSMETRFLNTDGNLADRLMAALQGAKVIGADTRCFQYGTSTLSAFIRVAKKNNNPDSLYLDLNVPALPDGYDPIDSLQILYNEFKATDVNDNELLKRSNGIELYSITPDRLLIKTANSVADKEIIIYDFLGNTVLKYEFRGDRIEIDLTPLNNGMYFLKINSDIIKFIKL